jgi:DNA-directed RNA polymerase II subunit RPB1
MYLPSIFIFPLSIYLSSLYLSSLSVFIFPFLLPVYLSLNPFYLPLTPFYLPSLPSISPSLPSISPSLPSISPSLYSILPSLHSILPFSLLSLCLSQSFLSIFFPPPLPRSFSSLSPFSSPHSLLYTVHSLPSIPIFSLSFCIYSTLFLVYNGL